MHRHLAITGAPYADPFPEGPPRYLQLARLCCAAAVFCQRLEPTRDTWRLRIRRPQMFGEKRDPGVVAEILVAEILPVPGAKLDKYHRPERTNHSADDRARRGPVFQNTYHPPDHSPFIRLTSACSTLSTGGTTPFAFIHFDRHLSECEWRYNRSFPRLRSELLSL